ncbi:MAG: hypothetical protein KJ626_05750 [Verrucomicrobia bacterium]|nr:hypothetical protein [Verrucomicrobiota bacterium]
MKTLLRFICLLILTGCSPDASRLAEMQEQLDAKSIRISELQKEVQDAKQEAMENVAVIRSRYDEQAGTLEKKVAQLESEIVLKNDRIAKLAIELKDARTIRSKKAKGGTPPDKSEPAVVRLPPNPMTDEFKVRETSKNSLAAFPVRVFGVEGKQVVTGSYETSRFVDFAEPHVDEEGNAVPGQWETQKKNEYGYKVFFSMESLSSTALKVSVRAGVASEEIYVAPGTTVKDMSVNAAKGSDLRVTVSGRSKSFPVEYGN